MNFFKITVSLNLVKLTMFKFIKFDIDGPCCFITLNRPEVYNAFNEEMLNELQDAFKKISEDNNIRAVGLTGEGKAFSSGQDLKSFNEKNSGFKDALDNRYNPLIRSIADLDKPVVCGLNGVAAGAGMSLALASDIRIASESASMTEVFINVGLVPDSGSSFYLPRLVGFAKAFELCLTAEKISARDAYRMGLVNKLVNAGLFRDYFVRYVKAISEKPTKSVAMIKSLLKKSFESSLSEMLDLESKYQEIAGATDDFREGVNSFLEKRKPVFKGK